VSRPLRIVLVGLVLTNLGFAYITDSADWSWLGPLLALTLLAPWLARWSSLVVYRAVWNAAVLATFGLGVHHVTRNGSAHLLEDGLMLAALCQVHLLNNLGRLQKPDLLFFNSFLIAIVTSFLSVDVGYSIMFACYAPLLVLSLQLLAIERGRGASTVPLPSPGDWRRILGSGAVRAATILVLTIAVFVLWPRDFARKGMFGDGARLQPPAALSSVDFSKSVSLDQLGSVTASSRVVLRVHLRDGSRHQVPQHWRGATLDIFDGTRWYPAPDNNVLVGRRWRRGRTAGTWLRGNSRRGNSRVTTHVAVERVGGTADRLPVPLSAQRLEIVGASERANVRPANDQTFRTRRRAPRRYDLELATEGKGSPMRRRIDMNALTHTRLHAKAVPAEARELAQRLRKSVPANAGPSGLVNHIRDHLASSYAYLPPGADGGASSLREFLTTARGGHCEYFASAMVVMLRTLSIPCRLVTGYRSDEWDEEGSVLLIRARHAHAWVEVYDVQRGWVTVDPTPPADDPAALARLGFWTRARYRMSNWWDQVMGFNATTSGRVRAWLASIPAMVKQRPGPVVGLTIALAALVFFLRRLRAPRIAPAVRAYTRTLRRLGVDLHPGETPRELLDRTGLEDDQRAVLLTATRDHERARYSESVDRMSATSVTPGFGSS